MTALGCQVHSLHTMLLGRAIFGLGGESISVAQSAMITQARHACDWKTDDAPDDHAGRLMITRPTDDHAGADD